MTGPETPRVVGRYALYKPISRGGMATVHYGRLRGESGFARSVAIKRLLPGFTSEPEFVTMLVDEARIAGRVQHPNVVQIIDVIQDDGEPLLVLEYVHGSSLSHLLREVSSSSGRLPAAVAAAIAVDALRGLHAAHEARDEAGEPLEIVHRDVSPQNILLDVVGMARVTDFGVAKARGRLQRTTETGALKGKIGYLAPEQIHGSVSRQSDVFSLGVVLWEMLTGARLFTGESEGAILALTLSARIDPPSQRGADCSRELDEVVLKSLERDPALRFATAADMADALTAVIPLASQAEVATWLEAVAGSLIDERRRVLQEIESGAGTAAAAEAPESGPVAAEEARGGRRERRTVAWAAIALAAFAALTSAFVFAFVRRDAAAPEPIAAPLSATVVAERPPTPAPPQPEPASDDVNARSLSSANRPKPGATPGVVPRAPASAKRGAKRQGADCTVPYDLDAQGRKTWRRECF